MKEFDWSRLEKRIYVDADVRTVFDYWTKSSLIECWFLSESTYYDRDLNEISLSSSIETGFSYKWGWVSQEETENGEIVEVVAFEILRFTFAGECEVTVSFDPIESGVMVSLVQSNIPSDDNSKQNPWLGYAFAWSFYLVNLKSVIEGGLDLRNRNTAVQNVVNN